MISALTWELTLSWTLIASWVRADRARSVADKGTELEAFARVKRSELLRFRN